MSSEEQGLVDHFAYDPKTGVVTRTRDVYAGNNRCMARAGSIAGRPKLNGYLHVSWQKKKFHVHRLAWFLHYGSWPTGQIDHVNGNRTDNRLDNLRDVSQSKNMRNQHKKRGSDQHLPVGIHRPRLRDGYTGHCEIHGRRRVIYRKTLKEAVAALEELRNEMGFYGI